MYGHFTSFVAPDLFQPLITIYIFLAVTAGGTGRPAGALAGAYAVIVFLEATRFVAEAIPRISPLQAAAAREALVGVALILLLRWRPAGLLPELSTRAPRP
jgi:branched-chain amino acid transport system permease protein